MLSFDAKKIIILAVFFIDCALHGAVVFGWSSIDQIIKHENYFNDVAETTSQSQISGQIFVLCIGILGILLLLFGFIRDFVSFGLARVVLYVNLILSYTLIALATPTDHDYMIYLFIMQMGSGIGILLSCLQFTMFYPKHQSLLVGIANTCMAASSIMPQIWLQAILQTSITFTQLMIVWICLAFVSLTFGIVFYPWHNLPDEGEITINDIKELRATLCEKIPLVKIGKEYPTIGQKLRESGSFLKSPMFYIHMVSFAMGNCMITLTINIANDILSNYSLDELEENQKTFEVMRVVITIIWGPVMGFLTDLYAKCIKDEIRDAKTMLLPCVVNFVIYGVLVITALIGANHPATMWIMFTALACGMSNIYIFETLGIQLSFPNHTQGVMFAFVELTGTFSLIQLPIVDGIKRDYLTGFDTFSYVMLGMFCFMVPFWIILFLTAFNRLPKCLQKLDQARQDAVPRLRFIVEQLQDEKNSVFTEKPI